jgi:hypothetical protein
MKKLFTATVLFALAIAFLSVPACADQNKVKEPGKDYSIITVIPDKLFRIEAKKADYGFFSSSEYWGHGCFKALDNGLRQLAETYDFGAEDVKPLAAFIDNGSATTSLYVFVRPKGSQK